ncbi:MAG: D-amino acid dehydrogenase [Pseudomonadota bacterium]
MQVAVIGGGVVGVCTAYFLAQAGHEVVVIERYGNVAQESSFGNAGLIAPAYAGPWAAPDMPKYLLSFLLRHAAPVLLKPSLDPALWRWIRMWMSECTLARYNVNKERMQRVAFYSHAIQQQMSEHYALDYEQTRGVLQLFRNQRELQLSQPALDVLARSGVEHRLLDADAARLIEPALSGHTPMAAALYLPQDESGNCALFTRQLKAVVQSIGVEFHFNSPVDGISREENRITMRIGEKSFSADAVVVAAGIDSARLLAPLGIRLPLCPVKSYSATAVIKNFEQAPQAALIDETYRAAITRMGSRIRIAGIAELGARSTELRESVLRTLVKVGEDWLPDAANYNTATFWSGFRPMLPDGAPLIGATPIKNVFINIGHGSAGWTMAAGSGKALADIISGRPAEIDMDGLTLSRYG